MLDVAGAVGILRFRSPWGVLRVWPWEVPWSSGEKKKIKWFGKKIKWFGVKPPYGFS